ncbi:restriction endonuclease [Georgenia wutianyii]|uniref:Restriction endonuclease n=1 Tax=Georgenia wutianyii TaxID=2585135 RepID=A0ABX5VNP0_9MICO|nr:restriction endonuclease [Georgenia wutianyii]QDB79603.1 restriction endonuclease [Georgenia wutianyii]
MRRIELAENDPTGRVVALSSEVATELAGRGLLDVAPVPEDRWRLTPLPNKIGAVRVGQHDVVVQPKARFASIMFMLGYARDPGLSPEEFSGATEDDVWPLVGETLARLASQAVLRGVLQGYVTEDASLTVLRGRVRVADQIARRPGLPLPLEVRYDEYAVDIPENRILRTALHRMALVPGLQEGLRRRLIHLTGRLEGASVLPAGAPIPGWRPSRLNARYHSALRLSELVLRTIGLGTAEGGEPVASFAVDMATTFEDFVAAALREALSRVSTGRTECQYSVFLDTEKRVAVKPDVVHIASNAPRSVFDAKYKLASRADVYPTPDLYQMHAYCTILGLPRGYLVYAGSKAEGVRPSTHRIARTQIDVVTWPLDVTTSPTALLAQVGDLAATAVEWPAAVTIPA